MPKTFTPRYLKPKTFSLENHWATGLEWTVEGSKGNRYTVSVTPKGFSCDCTGMTYHGKCKHTLQALRRFVDANRDDLMRRHYTKKLEKMVDNKSKI